MQRAYRFRNKEYGEKVSWLVYDFSRIKSFAERKTVDSKRLADFMPASISSYWEAKKSVTSFNYNSNNTSKDDGSTSVNSYIK